MEVYDVPASLAAMVRGYWQVGIQTVLAGQPVSGPLETRVIAERILKREATREEVAACGQALRRLEKAGRVAVRGWPFLKWHIVG